MATTSPHLILHDAPLSVAGITLYIQDLLEQDTRLQQVWVVGEVSSANHYRSGLFFTLQDPDADAAISGVIWTSQLGHVTTLPIVGEQVIVLGRLRLHRKRGIYQLNAWQILPAGEGLRALRNRQLRQRLETEGLFDPAHKRSLPSHPRTIAVVTSPQAAAWGDIQRTLKRRYPGLHVLFSPALVQGNQAPHSIIKAIRRVEQDGRAEVMIISRGGGATEDMDCFNDERVVRAIAQCPIPTIAGIGHQRDESLADLVADAYVHTPTAAAEQSVPQLAALIHHHQARQLSLAQALHQHLAQTQGGLDRLRERLERSRVDRRLSQEHQRIHWQKQRLQGAIDQQLEQSLHHCQLLSQQLADLDPRKVLKRGYALVRSHRDLIEGPTEEPTEGPTEEPTEGPTASSIDGPVVRSVKQIQSQDRLCIEFSDGRIQVTVHKVIPDDST